MIRRGRYPAAALLLASALAAPLAGQGGTYGALRMRAPAVRVERTGASTLDALPGQRVTAVFRVSRGPAERVRLAAALPPEWQGIVGAAPPTEPSFVHLLPFVVPTTAAAGRYVVRLAAHAGSGSAADSVIVRVPEVRDVALVVTGSPRFAAAGTRYTVTARVTNRGNASVRVRVVGEASRGFTPQVEAPELTLAPRAGADVRVTVSTPRGTDGARVALVRLRADVVGGGGSARAQSRVEVVPRGDVVGRHQLPITVGVRGSAGDAPSGLPATVTAAGPLSSGGRTRVDLSYRGAGAAAPELGERAHLTVLLRSPSMLLRAGDHHWSLSPLTEPGRSGFGAGGRFGSTHRAVEAFVQRDRRVPGSPTVAGIRAEAGTQAASARSSVFWPGGDSAAASAGVRLRPLPGLLAEGEYGVGLGQGAGTRGHDVRVQARARWGGAHLSDLRTDAGFPGRQGGRRQTSAAAHVQPVPGVRLHASWSGQRRVREEIVEDTLPALEPPFVLERQARSSSLRAGVRVSALSAEYRESRWGDFGAPEAHDRISRSVLGEARVREGRLSMSAGAEAGASRPAGEDADGEAFRRVWLRSGLNLPRQAFLWATVERHSRPPLAGGTSPGPRVWGSLHAGGPLTSSTRLVLSSQAILEDDGRLGAGYVDAALEQRLRGGQSVRVRARNRVGAGSGEGWKLWLDYRLPIGVPTSLRRPAGTVHGRVLDARGRGVADALVRAGGRAAVTDAQGRWAIGGLAPRRYTLEVDPLTAGVGTLPAQRDVLNVDLTERAQRLDVTLAPAGRVWGAFQLFLAPAFGRGGDPLPGGGVPRATLEARQGEERLYRSTDEEGRFDFPELRPGRWVLRVASADLPPNTAVQPDSIVLEVGPGSAQEIHLRAMPARRTLTIVAAGDLSAGPAAQPPARPAPAPVAPPAAAAAPDAPEAPARETRVATRVVVRDAPEETLSPPSWTGLRDWVDTRYEVQAGDRDLAAIAWLVYSDGALWPKLWLANRDRLGSAERLDPGTVLVVPPKAPLTPAERQAAEQYLRARSR